MLGQLTTRHTLVGDHPEHTKRLAVMKFLVVLSCALACALAKPQVVLQYGAMGGGVVPFGGYYGGVVGPYSTWGSPLAYSAPVVHPATVGVKTQYHTQDILGQAAYGHIEPGHAHTAVQDAAGNKVGTFSFVKADGTVARTDYVADALGYRVASNDLPVAHIDTPLPIAETAEVVAARTAHLAEIEKAKSRTRRDVILPASTSPLVVPTHVVAPITRVATPIITPLAYTYPHHVVGLTHHVPVVTPSGHVLDTPEVVAARVAHLAEVHKVATRTKRAAVIAAPGLVTPYTAGYTGAYGYSYTHPLYSATHGYYGGYKYNPFYYHY